MTAPLATIIAALIAAFLGSSLGAYFALSRFKKERAFDRQLDWYERAIRALHDMAQKIEIAATFEDEGGDKEHRIRCWRGVQHTHLVLDALSPEAELYASSQATETMNRILSQVQKVADETNGFDDEDAEDETKLELVEKLPGKLRKAASPLAKEARRHLGLS